MSNEWAVESVTTLLDRARIYNFISCLFSDPDLEKFQRLKIAGGQKDILESCGRMGLSDAATTLVEMLDESNRERIKQEHDQVFGHTLSKESSPYELEFLKNKEVFSLTQGLADITGFYAAFGLEMDATERPDHIGVEAEFLSFLILKEALAIENSLTPGSLEVCRQAQRDFFRDHFCPWTWHFAESLIRQTAAPFYNAAGVFLKSFIQAEMNGQEIQT